MRANSVAMLPTLLERPVSTNTFPDLFGVFTLVLGVLLPLGGVLPPPLGGFSPPPLLGSAGGVSPPVLGGVSPPVPGFSPPPVLGGVSPPCLDLRHHRYLEVCRHRC